MIGEFYLYRHIRLDTNEPFYIGIGTKRKKYNTHKLEYARAYVYSRRSKFWNSIIAKTDYRVEIMFESDNYETIKEKELEFIELYGRRDVGTGSLVNLTNGGEGITGFKHSEKTRRKMSKFWTNRSVGWLHTPEMLEKKKKNSRDKAKEVVHLKTGEVYNCLSEACEIFNLHYPSEKTRLRRSYSTATFKYKN
jgi:hypothetical protein